MNNKYHESFSDLVLYQNSHVSLAIALTLALLLCSPLCVAQTPGQPATAKHAGAGNINHDRLQATKASDTSPGVMVSAKAIDFISGETGSKTGTIYINDQNILMDFDGGQMTNLFTAEGLTSINHSMKTYRVHSYDEIKAIAKSQKNNNARPAIEYRLTGETDVIDGLKARKLIKLRAGVPEDVMWISSDLLPEKLRAFGEGLLNILSKDYLNKADWNLGMPEIIMLYGIPIKMNVGERNIYRVRVDYRSISVSKFQLPVDYKKLENR